MLLFVAGAEKKADSKSCVRPPTSNSGATSLMSSTPPDLGKELPPVGAPNSAIGSALSSSGIRDGSLAASQHYNNPLLPPSASSGFDLVKKEPTDRLYSPDLSGAASAYHLGGGGGMVGHSAPNHHHLASPPSLSGPHTHHLHDLGTGGSSLQSGGMLGGGGKQSDGYNSGGGILQREHSPLHHLVPPSSHHHPAHHSHHHHAPGGLLDHHSAAAAAAFFRSEADALRSETDSHQRLC